MGRELLFPQRATAANAEVLSVEWLFEPLWPGERLLVRIDDGAVDVSNAMGEAVAATFPEVPEVVPPAVAADVAIVDGVWTVQPFVGDGSLARTWAETLAEEGLADELPDPLASERRRAFVAVDLLELDGQELYDVPFQERRRLLESVIAEGVQVRLSPVVKFPVAGWLVGWRENGFTHYLAKHQNSRYTPGERSDDWLKLSLRANPPRGLVGRLVGFGRGERIRRIRD
jgi:bifunctional non-homologous end joining protein LigD